MRVGDFILVAAAEAGIDESIWNAFINGNYLSNIRDDPDGQCLRVHFNAGLTYINNIGEIPGYSNHVWYDPKGIANILSLGLVKKHYLVTYNSQYGNEFFIHITQLATFKMTKAGLFYHDMRHLINKKMNLHIMVNDLRFLNPQVEEKKKQYTACDVNRAYFARQSCHITGQSVKRILNVVDNNVLQNLPILQEDSRVYEDIYVPSVPYLQVKTVCHKI